MEVLFKKIAVEQLSNLLSKYVVGLDVKKLNTTDDTVTLKKLTLQENDLPGVGLRVKGGYINTLMLKVPWKRLKKESVVVTVDQVFVVLGARAVTGVLRLPAAPLRQRCARSRPPPLLLLREQLVTSC
jgi:hypothetical protein